MGKNTVKDPDLQIQGYALILEDLLLTTKGGPLVFMKIISSLNFVM